MPNRPGGRRLSRPAEPASGVSITTPQEAEMIRTGDTIQNPVTGETNKKGFPNPFRLAVIAKAHFDTVRLPFPPAWLQRLGLVLGAPLGRALGYRATYGWV